MADSKLKDLTAKTTVVASDEFYGNDVAGGNLDKKYGADDIKTFMSLSPTLVTPALGTPASGVMTNVSGTASSLTAGNVTTNANSTGDVTSVGNATTIAAKAVEISMLDDGTDGELITWDSSGVATTVAVGSANEVLTSNGAGAAPTFQAAAGGGDMVLADVQTVTGAKTFGIIGGAVGKFILAGSTSGSTILNAAAAAGTTTATLQAVTGTVALLGDKLSAFAATTSAELAGVISNETGSGLLVFGTSPTLITPALGTPASGVMTNVTGVSGITGFGTLTQDVEFGGVNIQSGGVIFLKEQAEADADVAGEGQIWVDTQTPNKLFFTDDAGTDHDLTAGGATVSTQEVDLSGGVFSTTSGTFVDVTGMSITKANRSGGKCIANLSGTMKNTAASNEAITTYEENGVSDSDAGSTTIIGTTFVSMSNHKMADLDGNVLLIQLRVSAGTATLNTVCRYGVLEVS